MTINESTKFFIYRMPNHDCLNQTLTHNEIALLDNSAASLRQVFQQFSQTAVRPDIILFICVQGKQHFSGVCKVTSTELTSEFRDDWSLFWQGTFKAAIKVQWLIPFCEVPFSKVSALVGPVFARSKAPPDASNDNVFDQVEYFTMRQKSLFEMSNEVGLQLSRQYVEH